MSFSKSWLKKSPIKSHFFFNFASNTTLHGWRYLTERPLLWLDGVYWVFVLGVVHLFGFAFVYSNTSEYFGASIQTTIESTTTPLNEIYFPAITICNINQVEASLLAQMNIFGDLNLMNPVYKEFVEGGNLTLDERKKLDEIQWLKWHNYKNSSFSEAASQPCHHMILELEFQGKKVSWFEMNKTLGPVTVGTDYGYCCFLAPQVHLDVRSEDMSPAELLHYKVGKGAFNGEMNGLTLLIDVENFNFAYHGTGTWGAKLAIHGHRVKPLIQHQSILIHTGLQSNIAVIPSLFYTSDNALKRLKPKDRQCYEDKEVNLTYTSWSRGFEYDLPNCLLNLAIDKAYKTCKCTPHFARSLSENLNSNESGVLPYCTGTAITCVQKILDNIGEEGETYIIDDLRGYRREDKISCFSRCKLQVNEIQLSTALFPQPKSFHKKPMFCSLAKKLLEGPCVKYYNPKKKLIDETYPNLCELIESRSHLFKSCTNWTGQEFEKLKSLESHNNDTENQSILEGMLNYSGQNLARITVMIRDPYVQTIKRDVSVTFTSYIANMGGLLGLCLGFSFVSLAETVYHFFLKIFMNSTR